jgi:hypothetical protein
VRFVSRMRELVSETMLPGQRVESDDGERVG